MEPLTSSPALVTCFHRIIVVSIIFAFDKQASCAWVWEWGSISSVAVRGLVFDRVHSTMQR